MGRDPTLTSPQERIWGRPDGPVAGADPGLALAGADPGPALLDSPLPRLGGQPVGEGVPGFGRLLLAGAGAG